MRRVFRLPGGGQRIDRELEEEFRFHLEGRIEELMEREGLSREAAEREARRRFGDYEAYRRQARNIDDMMLHRRDRMELLDTIAREMRHAARTLWRTPSFSAIALITLALGIGATTAIYTVLDAVVLRPLPYRNADRLVSVLHPATVPGNGESKWGLSAAGYFYFKKENHTLEDLGGYQTGTITVTGASSAENVRAGIVTYSIFTTLGARAEVGRLVTAADDRPDSTRVVVLSHEFWVRAFGSDRAAVGKMLRTSDGDYQIIGVAEPGLTLPKPGPFASTADLAGFGVDVWFPEKLNPSSRPINSHQYSGIGRLKPGVTPQEAQADFARLMTRFPELFPTAYSTGFIQKYNFRIGIVPLRDEVLGPVVGRALWILFAAVALVLFIACANVANLFLVRLEARRRESAIRGALGGSRGQLAAHYLSESLLLTMTAGLAGLVIARITLGALLGIAPSNIPRLSGAGIGWTGALFAGGLSIVAGVVLGLIPSLRRAVDLATLRENSRGLTTSVRQRFARDTLVVGQVALALMLLAAAGLMLRSFANLRRVTPGFDPQSVVSFSVNLPYVEYKAQGSTTAFQQELHQKIAAIPGVTSVGAAGGLPLQDFGAGCTSVGREGRPFASDEKPPCVDTPTAMPGFFETLGIQVRGRTFTWSDVDPTYKSPTVAIVTRKLADRLWPGEDPMGKGIAIGDAARGFYRVVGVIPELRAHGLDQPPSEMVFWPAAGGDESFVVRTSLANPVSLMASIRGAIGGMNPRIPTPNARTMQEIVDRSVARASFVMTLLAIAGSMALLLSAVGIYGVISYLVTQRRPEIGIRMALGARVTQVAGLVLGQAMQLATVGVMIGLAGSLVGTRLLRSLLFGVSPTDALVLATTTVVLLVIAAVASLAPARRAARIDPVEAMRA
jgi:predicted permease